MSGLAMDSSCSRDMADDCEDQSPHQESTDCATVPLLVFLCIIVYVLRVLETSFLLIQDHFNMILCHNLWNIKIMKFKALKEFGHQNLD